MVVIPETGTSGDTLEPEPDIGISGDTVVEPEPGITLGVVEPPPLSVFAGEETGVTGALLPETCRVVLLLSELLFRVRKKARRKAARMSTAQTTQTKQIVK